MTKHGIEPVFDFLLEPGDLLDKKIKLLIDKSDCVVCLGTPQSFESEYCRDEVEYALGHGKPYHPVIVEEDPALVKGSPKWFQGSGLGRNVVIVACGMEEFVRMMPKFQQYTRWGLRWVVLLVFLLLLGVPVSASVALGSTAPLAQPEIRAAQASIEAINLLIENSRKSGVPSGSVQAVTDRNFPNTILYTDSNGNLIAKDVFERGLLQERFFLHERLFLNGGQVMGKDVITVQHEGGSDLPVLKTREIYLTGERTITIEDRFDSTGMLISKRVWNSADGEVTSYGDVGRSVYPVLLPMYR